MERVLLEVHHIAGRKLNGEVGDEYPDRGTMERTQAWEDERPWPMPCLS